MSVIKVRGGTTNNSGKSLCHSCRRVTIMTNYRGQELVICHALGEGAFRVPNKIISCSSYEDKSKPGLWEMEKTAWKLETNKKEGFLGFKPPKDHGEQYLERVDY